ncbi:protein serine/threonine kinase, putative [Entamoeba invadens IP1]|uniref:protein serine/threonine kinase, putative n=1 Tax=Entamoeba invadens IP1 TaxID=370355 RepID=UPI0002C3F1B5|nr:protein serine/threonine kinase, putative [Entamoeba invadens IP1]ELP94191.1 protein serine/threonine kinase, putative [Entamoeba invadens IP1]|eukprot:XP_004260962.1 protein serine/threonine kinase, putative [Entamoeba invadens IP1]
MERINNTTSSFYNKVKLKSKTGFDTFDITKSYCGNSKKEDTVIYKDQTIQITTNVSQNKDLILQDSTVLILSSCTVSFGNVFILGTSSIVVYPYSSLQTKNMTLFYSSSFSMENYTKVIVTGNLEIYNSSYFESFYCCTLEVSDNITLYDTSMFYTLDNNTLTIQNSVVLNNEALFSLYPNTKATIKNSFLIFDNTILVLNNAVILTIDSFVTNGNSQIKIFSLTIIRVNEMILLNSSKVYLQNVTSIFTKYMYLQGESLFSLNNDTTVYVDNYFEMRNKAIISFRYNDRLIVYGNGVDQKICDPDFNYNPDVRCVIAAFLDSCVITQRYGDTQQYPLFTLYNGFDVFNKDVLLKMATSVVNFFVYAKDFFRNDKSPLFLQNGRLQRFFVFEQEYDIHCFMNGTMWENEFNWNSSYPFITPNCPCSGQMCFVHTMKQKVTFKNRDYFNGNVVNADLLEIGGHDVELHINTSLNRVIYSDVLKIERRVNHKTSNKSDLKGEDATPRTLVALIDKNNNNPLSITLKFSLYEEETKAEESIMINENEITISLVQHTTSQDQAIAEIIQIAPSVFLFKANTNFSFNSVDNCQSALVTNMSECLTNYSLVCAKGYFVDFGKKCSECPSNCEVCTNTTKCIKCAPHYYLSNFQCLKLPDTCTLATNERCVFCGEGALNTQYNSCDMCLPFCKKCSGLKCILCKGNSVINYNGFCYTPDGSQTTNEYTITSCKDGYFLNDTKCTICTSLDIDCNVCNKKMCTKCNSNTLFVNNICRSPIGYMILENKIFGCQSGYSKSENGRCEKTLNDCLVYNNGCIKCNSSTYLSHGKCYTTVEKCVSYTTLGCSSCDFGYFVDSTGRCAKCDKDCLSCSKISTRCLSCDKTVSYLNNGTCVYYEFSADSCALVAQNGWCITCQIGYYKSGTQCKKCNKSCAACVTSTVCTTCSSNYYWLPKNGSCVCKNTVLHCLDSPIGSLGCKTCQDQYYLEDGNCKKCSNWCGRCKTYDRCLYCTTGVLINESCFNYTAIESCIKAKNSKCARCEFWRRPSPDGSKCLFYFEWIPVIVLLLTIIVVIIISVAISYFVIRKLVNVHNSYKNKYKHNSMKMSEYRFVTEKDTQNGIIVGERVINFVDDNLLIVNVPRVRTIVIGNAQKCLQIFQVVTGNIKNKVNVTSSPDVFLLKPNYCCEVLISVLPTCTFKSEEELNIIATSVSTNKKTKVKIKMQFDVEMSKRISEDEIVVKNIIGHGACSNVYSGYYRGQKVAVKEMKYLFVHQEKAQELLLNEIDVLEKIQNDFIISYIGCFTSVQKVILVEELAEFGSLQQRIDQSKEFSKEFKIKILKDSCCGLEYLHRHNILHRDVKPGNILLVDLSNNAYCNAKISDFGSSKYTVNTLNLTFTKAIGTPSFMSPEILRMEKYTKQADVYSFAVTMFETFIWDKSYPETNKKFEYPWLIADFVTSGKRIGKPDNMENSVFELISLCWDNNPNQRPTFEQIKSRLEKL